MSLFQNIAYGFTNYQSDKSLGFKFRKKRSDRIKSLINRCYNKYGKVNIIDVGGTRIYWNIIPSAFLLEHSVRITLVNLPSAKPLPAGDAVFEFVPGDGCNLSKIPDHSYNISHSNSVIEHVGDITKKCEFSHEMRRIAESYYLQTPNFWFPIEPHFFCPFFHWLPEFVRIFLIYHFNIGRKRRAKCLEEARWKVKNCSLLTKRELIKLFPEGSLFKEKFLLMTKSFIVVHDGF